MKTAELTLPEIALIAGTRGMLVAGIALLLGERIEGKRRRVVGWTLLAVGVVTTIPAAGGRALEAQVVVA
jgi:hypothetical protein